MKWAALAFLIAAAGVWAWALAPAPRSAPPALPDGLVGGFDLVRFVPAPEPAEATGPQRPAEASRWEFRADGTYLYTILSGGREMARREGLLSAEGATVTLTQVSENRTRLRAAPQPYQVSWRSDPEGRLLVLRHATEGHELLLRPIPGG
ncbi:MAG: hypothetical protein ACT4PV_00915 [Planctomycetaceae bacterium]